MKLPKLYAPVILAFNSTRGSLGSSGGFVEVDEMVTRKCRRVVTPDGWKWQIIDKHKIRQWDWTVDEDQEHLDNAERDYVSVVRKYIKPIERSYYL